MNRSCLLAGLVASLLIAPIADAQKPWQSSNLFAKGAKVKLLADKGAGEGPAYHPQLGLLTSGGHLGAPVQGFNERLGSVLGFFWRGVLAEDASHAGDSICARSDHIGHSLGGDTAQSQSR